MNEPDPTRRHTIEPIDGVQALVNLDLGELFLDLPITTPRYIRVREGHHIQEGDVRTKSRQTMASQTLSKWRIETISTDTVTGVDVDTGELREWDRKWLITQLGTGGLSVELTDFERVNVSETTGAESIDADDPQPEASPHLIVTVYGNNGQKFTQSYGGTEAAGLESISLVNQDQDVQAFDDELREKFDAAVAEALEMERLYHR